MSDEVVKSRPAPNQCEFCEVTEGNGVNINVCANCGMKCCTVHSVDAPHSKVLCEECAPHRLTPAAEVGAEARVAGWERHAAALIMDNLRDRSGVLDQVESDVQREIEECIRGLIAKCAPSSPAAPEARDYDPITSPIPAGDHNGPHGPLALDATAAGTSPSWGCCHPDEARDGKPENAPEEPR